MFSGDRKIPTRGPTIPFGNEACRVSQWTVDPRVGIFLEPLNTNDRFFFSYTTTVRYSTVFYLLMTSLRSMFTVNDARCINQLETANKQRIKQWTNGYFIKNGFTRTSLSATVTRVSNFVEENVCVWCVFTFQGSPSRWIQSLNAQHNRFIMSIAIHSACSERWIKVVSKNAQLYF